MQRYFFDVGTKGQIQYDYKGCDLSDSDQAKRLAELVALDVGCTQSDESDAVEVQVRDVKGRHLFSIPIQSL
jgi:hypothetical protein